jgi:hypothetical protein
MWASVVRGAVATRVKEPACPRPPPYVSAADFSALYERWMESGLKARLTFNHAAGQQTVTITCTLPAFTPSAATARKRRHRRTRRGRAATAACDNQSHPQPSSPVTADPTCENALPLYTATPPPPSPPEVESPLAKRVRRRRNEVELLRGPEEESEFLLSPLSSLATPAMPDAPATLATIMPPSITPPSLPSFSTRSDAMILDTTETLSASPTADSPAPPASPMLPILPIHANAISASPPSPPPSHHTSSVPTDSAVSEPATDTIPVAPPMTAFFPKCPFKVICRYCFRDDHDICYKQCPSCYRKRGGTNYVSW